MMLMEVGSGASQRVAAANGEKLIDAARRCEIDVVLVRRLDRRGRSITDRVRKTRSLRPQQILTARRLSVGPHFCAPYPCHFAPEI